MKAERKLLRLRAVTADGKESEYHDGQR